MSPRGRVALGLLDGWLAGRDPAAPSHLAAHTRLPAGHWIGERVTTDVLALADEGRAFRSLHTLTVRQGGTTCSTAARSAWPLPRWRARQAGAELAELAAA